jgi:hypothetical protein
VRAVEGTPVVRGAVVFCELSIRRDCACNIDSPASSCAIMRRAADEDVKPHDPVLLFCVPAGSRDASAVASLQGGANFVRLNYDRQNGYLVAWRFGRVPLCAKSQIVQYGDAEST